MNTNLTPLLFKTAPMGLAYLEINNNEQNNGYICIFTEVNQAFEQITGITSGSIVKQATVHENATNLEWISKISKIATKNEAVVFEHYFTLTNKCYLINAWHDKDNFFVITLTDLTTQRHTANADGIKYLYQNIFWDNNLFGIMIADGEGNYVDANQEACRMTGYTCDELKSMKFFEITDPGFVEESLAHFAQMDKTGKSNGELVYLTKSGERRWWNVVATRLSEGYYIGLHEDITNRKTMELELSRNIELNKKLISSLPDVVIQTNLEGVITFVNEPVLVDYPYITAEQLLGKNILSFVAPIDHARIGQNMRLMFEKPMGIQEYTLCFGNGVEINCEANGDVIRDANGNPVALVFVIRDITSRKKAAQLLIESEERFQLMVKNISAIIVTIDKDGVQQYVSSVAEKITGYKPEELMGKSISEVIHPDDLPQVIKVWNEGTGFPNKEFIVQYRHIHKTKAWVYLETVGQSFLNEPSVNAVIAIVHDITERKRVEEAMKESELKFRTLFENSSDAIFIMRGDTFIECNSATLEVYGCQSPEQILGKTPFDFSPVNQPNGQGSREYALEIIEAAIGGSTQFFEWTHLKLDGSPFTAEVKLNQLDLNGQILLQAIVRDITKRKQAEEALRESEERFLLAMNASDDGLFDWNLETNSIYYSPGYKKMLGYKDHELPNDFEVWQGNTDAEDAQKSWELQQKLITRQIDRFVMEFKMKHKDGHWVDILSRAEAIFNESGKAIRIVGTHTDITERKLTEKALKKSELEYRSLFEKANDAIFIFEPDSEIILDANFKACEIYGFTKDELVGLSLKKLSKNVKAGEEKIELTIKNGQYMNYETQHFNKCGETLYFLVNASVIEYKGKAAILSINRNMTERKQSELALGLYQKNLAEKEAQYRLIAENSTDLIYVYSLFPEPHYDYISPSSIKLLGYTPDEGYADPFFYHNFINTPTGFERFIKFLLDPDQPTTIEEEWRKKDGTLIWVEQVVSRKFDENGQIVSFQSTVRDITKRKLAEEALQTSDDIVRAIPSGLFIYQFEPPDRLILLTGNPAAEQLTGLQVDDWIGHEFNELWPQASQSNLTREYLHVIKTGKTFETEDLYYQDDRLSGAFRIRAFALAGNRLAVAFENITERKKAEVELNAGEKKFRELSTLMRLMADNMPDMLWAKNLNREYVFANKAICSNLLSAVDTEEPLGKTDMFFAMRERNSQPTNPQWHTFGEICSDSDSITLEGLKPMQFDEFGNVKGEFIFLDVRKAPLYDHKGELIGVVGSARDITERKALEERLKYQTKLRELLMEISTGFINIPLEKVESSVNEALSKIGQFVNADRAYTFDYDWVNSVCNNTYEWCNIGVDPEINNLQNLSLAIMMDTVVEHKKGKTVYIPDVNTMPSGIAKDFVQAQGVLSFIMVPMMNQKECIGFVGFDSVKGQKEYFSTEVQLLEVFAQLLANVKLRQEMVKQLVDSKLKAEEGDRLKSAFLANMSHEIRTPMNGILGFAELLKEPDLDGDEQQKYIAIIEKSGKRMLNIINDIIDISKIEAGLMQFHFSDTNVTEQIEYIHTFFKPEAIAKGLRISIKNSLTRHESNLFTDREKLYAILTNLVKNAIKYTEKGEIELGCNHKDNNIEFYVKDSGIGIPIDRQQAVFERFIQADIEDKMAKQGAGLGLAITKAYVEMLGGKIWLESIVSSGSTFYFSLPFNVKPENALVLQPNLAVTGLGIPSKKLKILIVEDDAISEMLLERNLRKIAKDLLKANSGIEAIEMMLANPDIDLVLMDIRLPLMDGYEAIRQIRQFNNQVVIIAQTAYGLAGDREKALEAGCNDYLAKPFRIPELYKAIQKYF